MDANIYDKCERINAILEIRERLEREYLAAKNSKDWAAASKAVDKMRALGSIS